MFWPKSSKDDLKKQIEELENQLATISKENLNLINKETKYKKKINKLEMNINGIKIKDLLHFKLELPKFQRKPDEKHIIEIYDFFKNNINDDIKHAIYLGICNAENDGIHYILDGSHRLEALRKLYSEGLIKEQKIQCIFIEKDTMEELCDEFKSINSNMPLAKIYIDLLNRDYSETSSDIMDDIDNDIMYNKINILENINAYFTGKYSNNFEPTYKKGMRRPKIVKTNFENNIYDFLDYYIEQNKDKKYTDETLIKNIITEIENLNSFYSTKHSNYFPMKGKRSHNDLLKRIKKNKKQMLLGMFPHTVWLKHLKEGVDDEIKSFNSLKDKVWDLYIGKDNKTAKCLCCNDADSKIKKSSFHFGHIHPQSKDGVTNVFNCIPICQSCNTRMGNTLLFDYMHNNNYDTNNPLFSLLKMLYVERGDLFKKTR